MKTTLNIDDDVLEMVKNIAAMSGLSIGKVISGYARTQLPRENTKSSPAKGPKTR